MTVTSDFAGRRAVVSGAAQGIGLALAQMFSKAGYITGVVLPVDGGLAI